MIKNKKILKIIITLILCFINVFSISCGQSSAQNNKTLHNAWVLSDDTSTEEDGASSVEDNLNVLFFPLGGVSDADGFIITIGSTQILVDGGKSKEHSKSIQNYMDKVMPEDDNVWDFIFITHGDSDHIGGFICENNIFSHIKEKEWEIGHLIDFDMESKKQFNEMVGYNTYVKNRDKTYKEIINKYQNSFQALEENHEISLGDSGKCTLEILNNRFYNEPLVNSKTEKEIPKSHKSAYKNAASLCFLITYGTEKFLFTGDLAQYDTENPKEKGYSPIGVETELVKNNPILSEGVTFFKASHHGSSSANSENFVNNIHPNIVVFPSIAGSTLPGGSETVPSNIVVDRFFKYTDTMLIPSVLKETVDEDGNVKKEVIDYYGEILITSDGKETKAYSTSECDYADRVTFIGKEFGASKDITETDYYDYSHTINTYVFSGYQSEKNAYMGRCTLVKYGNTDILIDCGASNARGSDNKNTTCYLDKLDDYIVDKTIDLLIVTSTEQDCLQQLVPSNKSEGVLNSYKVNKILDFGTVLDGELDSKTYLKKYEEIRKSDKYKNKVVSAKSMQGQALELVKDILSVEVLQNEYYESDNHEDDVSVCVNFYGQRMLFTGKNTKKAEESIIDNNDSFLNNICFFQAAGYGFDESNIRLLEKINGKKSLYFAINCVAGAKYFNKNLLGKDATEAIINNTKLALITEQMVGKNCALEAGDINFYIKKNSSSESSEMFTFGMNGSNKSLDLKDTNYYKSLCA